MEFLQPRSWAEALAAKAAAPEALPIAGGTDVMVELNFDRRRPPALLDLSRVPELTGWAVEGGDAARRGVTYAELTGSGRQRAAAGRPGEGRSARAGTSSGGGCRGWRWRPDGRVAADPQPGHDRRQPRLGVAGRRLPSVAARGGRGGRGRLGPGHPADPDRRLLHRGQAERAGSGRADRGRLDQPAVRARAVRQDRHQERDGDRGGGVRAGAASGPRAAVGTGIGSAAPTPVRAERGGGVPGEPRWTRPGCGSRGRRCRSRS